MTRYLTADEVERRNATITEWLDGRPADPCFECAEVLDRHGLLGDWFSHFALTLHREECFDAYTRRTVLREPDALRESGAL